MRDWSAPVAMRCVSSWIAVIEDRNSPRCAHTYPDGVTAKGTTEHAAIEAARAKLAMFYA